VVEKGYFEKLAGNLPEGVDPRLDNRPGKDRPPMETDPAVPQQVDGPDLMHQAEHARAVAEKAAAADVDGTERKGMFSPGGHSLADESERGGNDAGQANPIVDRSLSSDASTAADPAAVVAPSAEQAEEIAKDAERATPAAAAETATSEPGAKRTRTAPADKAKS
jgi:hypothetical protein